MPGTPGWWWEDQHKFMNLITHGQRGRMEDQCCILDPSRSTPCSPLHADGQQVENPETFFDLLAHTQSHRLDDQRVSLPSLPGLQKESNSSNGDSNYLSATSNLQKAQPQPHAAVSNERALIHVTT
uniref:Uncharacterized protein n=1 Tax=Oryzias latipes TaxID=8090 RepID=A0A3P9JED7_ORYLA